MSYYALESSDLWLNSQDCICSLYIPLSSNCAGAVGTTDPQSGQSPNSEPQSGTVDDHLYFSSVSCSLS